MALCNKIDCPMYNADSDRNHHSIKKHFEDLDEKGRKLGSTSINDNKIYQNIVNYLDCKMDCIHEILKIQNFCQGCIHFEKQDKYVDLITAAAKSKLLEE